MNSESTLVPRRPKDQISEELANEVNAELSAGWEPQGGVVGIQVGTGVYLIQALAKHP